MPETNENPREGVSRHLAVAAGPDLDSTVDLLVRGAIEPHDLPTRMHDIWVLGFRTGVERMQNRVYAAERAADGWYYVANNPDTVRAEHEKTLRLFQTAKGRESDARRRRALDHLERTDPVEYRRVVWLGLTDRPEYIAALAGVDL